MIVGILPPKSGTMFRLFTWWFPLRLSKRLQFIQLNKVVRKEAVGELHMRSVGARSINCDMLVGELCGTVTLVLFMVRGKFVNC